MRSGVIADRKEEEIADFLINSGYGDLDVIPVTCIQTGSRVYGLHSKESDRDYLAIHLMDTWNCLEHPKFRTSLQVIRKSYDQDHNEVTPGPDAKMSLDSFELWKTIDLWIKGAFSIYELLYLPTIHHDPTSEYLLTQMRNGLTTKIGYAAIGIYNSDWRKRPHDRKKTVMAFYRLIQSIFLLREGEFQWNAQQLWDYLEGDIPAAKATLELYMKPNSRKTPLTKEEIYFVEKELEGLVRETKNAIMSSRLPDRVPTTILKEVLHVVKMTRGKII